MRRTMGLRDDSDELLTQDLHNLPQDGQHIATDKDIRGVMWCVAGADVFVCCDVLSVLREVV
jgi:hypothetical protein